MQVDMSQTQSAAGLSPILQRCELKATSLIHWTKQQNQLCRQNKPYLWHLLREEDLFSWGCQQFNILVRGFACLISTPFLTLIVICQKFLFVLAF